LVTGVQTCALPIFPALGGRPAGARRDQQFQALQPAPAGRRDYRIERRVRAGHRADGEGAPPRDEAGRGADDLARPHRRAEPLPAVELVAALPALVLVRLRFPLQKKIMPPPLGGPTSIRDALATDLDTTVSHGYLR